MNRLPLLALLVLFAAGSLCALSGTSEARRGVPGGRAAPEYWLAQWHVRQLWAGGADGQGVTIAEIDTGVDASIPELRGKVQPGIDLGDGAGNGRVDRDIERFGHGTSMATIMVGRPGRLGIRGLAPGATVLPVAVPMAGTTDQSPDDHLAQAIRWATAHGADVISMALAAPRSSTGPRCPPSMQHAVIAALRAGAIVFAAGGNRGPDDNAVEAPGACEGVVSVGGVDRTGRVAAFSSRHRYLTMTAPGVDIASIGRGGAPYAGDGTSQASALAAAAAAVVWSRYPRLSGQQVITRLLATLDDRRLTPDRAYGYGRLDLYRAVTAPVPAGAPNPVFGAVARLLRVRTADLAQSAPAQSSGVWSNVRLAIGLLVLIAGALIALTWAGVAHRRAVLIAAVRALVQLAVVALALRGVFAAPPAVVGVLAIMFGVATWTAARRLAGQPGAGRAVVLSCGVGAAVTVAVIVGLPTLNRDLRDLIAVSGIVVGGTMTAATLTGRRLAAGLRDRRDEIEGWLAIGATPRQAVRPIARHAVFEALVPALDQTRTVGLVTLPGAFVGALLGGVSAEQAARFQIVVLVGLLCAESITAGLLAYLLGAPATLPPPEQVPANR